MTFQAPWFGLLILVLPVCMLLYRLAKRRQRAALGQLIGKGMRPEPRTDRRRGGVGGLPSPTALASVIVCLVLALMQPLWGKRTEALPHTGRDIVVLLDTSLSMLAEDVRPNRLEHAKAAIRRLVGAVKADGGHRLALVAFAGRPSLQCPLTLDYDLFLQRLDEADVETAVQEGSLIGDALHHALERLDGLKPGLADLILATDGEDHGGSPMAGAAAAASAGIDLYPLAIGDPNSAAPIPVAEHGFERSLLHHDGFEVRSRVRADLLADMAAVTKGRFLGAGNDIGALERLYHEVLARKPGRQLGSEAGDMPAHRFQWLVLLALGLLIVDRLRLDQRARTA
jgi:Ca-activated chloride channel family protein